MNASKCYFSSNLLWYFWNALDTFLKIIFHVCWQRKVKYISLSYFVSHNIKVFIFIFHCESQQVISVALKSVVEKWTITYIMWWKEWVFKWEDGAQVLDAALMEGFFSPSHCPLLCKCLCLWHVPINVPGWGLHGPERPLSTLCT